MRITIIREVKVPASAGMNRKLEMVNTWITAWQKDLGAAIHAVRPVDEETFTVEMMVEEEKLDQAEQDSDIGQQLPTNQ